MKIFSLFSNNFIFLFKFFYTLKLFMNIQVENLNNNSYRLIIDSRHTNTEEQRASLIDAFQKILLDMNEGENDIYTYNTSSFMSAINQMINSTLNGMEGVIHGSRSGGGNQGYEFHIGFDVYEEEEDTTKRFSCCREINEKLGKSVKIKEDENTESCFICIEPFKKNELKRVLPKCEHAYHKKCIDKWLKNASTCPICRLDLLDLNMTNGVPNGGGDGDGEGGGDGGGRGEGDGGEIVKN